MSSRDHVSINLKERLLAQVEEINKADPGHESQLLALYAQDQIHSGGALDALDALMRVLG